MIIIEPVLFFIFISINQNISVFIKLNTDFDVKLNKGQQEIVDFLKEYNEGISRRELVEKFSVSRVNLLIEKNVLIQLSMKLLKNYKKIILSGDSEEVCRKVSEELGIEEYYAQLLPEEKMKVLVEMT